MLGMELEGQFDHAVEQGGGGCGACSREKLRRLLEVEGLRGVSSHVCDGGGRE